MPFVKHRTVLALGLALGAATALSPQATAQPFNDPGPPLYTRWQQRWDLAAFRSRHVIVGEVIDFHPYRVRLRRSNGVVQEVDLKHGTTILPTGATPTPGERVALIGYYSQGTFIVNRLIIR